VNDALENVLQNPRVWRGSERMDALSGSPAGLATAYPTGYARLDRLLPGGGWPRHALTEILLEHYGTGELKLLMPALARLSNAEGIHPAGSAGREQAGWVAWIAPPFQPYPPALLQWGICLEHMLMVHPGRRAEALWAAEQALSSGNCAAVLLWSEVLDNKASRRLQLAAEKGRSWAIAFRPLEKAAQSSAAALRIALSAGERGTDVRILKSRGGRPVTVSGIIHDYAG
jgi:cell division inhibitor SulA/protein ImuA